ncbi:DUF6261 family protein [Streptococcus sp. 27098_8_113]|uniref:DUF6261 family protein n=1 Tax=Streptococcus sp. 27098_8_113 TaxID=3003669 RepID=UPI00352DAB84
MKYKITSLDMTRLEGQSFFQLLSDSLEAVNAFTKANKTELVYISKASVMEPLLEQFQASLHNVRAGKFTENLEKADRERDDALVTLLSFVKAFSRVKVPAIQTAYEELNPLFKQCKGITTTSYEKETESINHLLKQLAQSNYQPSIQALNLTEYIESLKAAQAKFEKVYKERLAEQAEKSPSQAKALRLELTEMYEFLVDFTAINAYAYPDKAYFASLRDHLNIIRSRYKKRKPTKKVKEEVAESN